MIALDPLLPECHRTSNNSNPSTGDVTSDRRECGSGDLGGGDRGDPISHSSHPSCHEEAKQGLCAAAVDRESWVYQHSVHR